MKFLDEKIIKILSECEKHIKRINEASKILQEIAPLNANEYEKLSEEFVRVLDQFIFRFTKLQDAMGSKLFKNFLLYLDEDIENFSQLDIINRLEKLGLLNAQKWRELRELRNELTHEYEDDSKTTVQLLNKLFEERKILFEYFSNFKKAFEKARAKK